MIWIAVGFCILVSLVFSGIEAGILSVNRVRLKHQVRLGDAPAIALERLLARPERVLVTVLFVTNFMTISAIILSTTEIVASFGTRGYLIAGAIWLPLHLAVIELLPKSMFRRFPYRALAALTGLLRVTDLLLSPLLSLGERLMQRLFPRAEPGEKKLFIAREDFKYLTVESERQGTLTATEREMIHNVVDFRSVTARDLMTPIERIQSVRSDMPIEQFLEEARRSGIERAPIASPAGEIVGLINVMDVLLEPERRAAVEAYQRRLFNVRDDELAYSIMRKFRAARIRLAAVHDISDRPLGMVTWDQLIHKLVKSSAS